MREIKFRAWDGTKIISYENGDSQPVYDSEGAMPDEIIHITHKIYGLIWMQYTGLKDKNGDKEVYECDIIDTEGNIIGNQYETPTLLERKTNLLIQGFGTKDWLATYSQAVERGCHDA